MKIFRQFLAVFVFFLTASSLIAQPTTAAPTPPARSASDVLSCFSGAYTNIAGIDWNPNWGQSTQVSTVAVAGDTMRRYASLNYQGVQFAAPINVSTMTNLHLDIWTANCTSFEVFLINAGPVEKAVAVTPVASGWKSIDIPLSSYTSGAPVINLSSIIQFKFVGTPFGTSDVYVDNIYFWKPSNAPTLSNFTIPAKTVGDPAFTLTAPTSNSTGAFTYTSSNTAVATINGSTVTIVGAGSSIITANQAAAGAFGAGSISATLNVATPSPTTAAPTPTRTPASVISLFSNPYTNRTVDTWSAVWDNADVEDVQIAGNATKKYTNLVFAGIEFVGPNRVNATNFPYLHMDIWSANATTFKIKLVDFGANGAFGGGDDTEHELTYTPGLSQWVPYNIPLSAFTGMTGRSNISQMILVSSNSTVFVDNVYFFQTGVGTNEVTFANDLFTATPTAADNFVNINLSEKAAGEGKITITNIMGQEVFAQKVVANNSNQTINVATSSFAAGTYIVTIHVGKSFQSQKIIVNH